MLLSELDMSFCKLALNYKVFVFIGNSILSMTLFLYTIHLKFTEKAFIINQCLFEIHGF